MDKKVDILCWRNSCFYVTGVIYVTFYSKHLSNLQYLGIPAFEAAAFLLNLSVTYLVIWSCCKGIHLVLNTLIEKIKFTRKICR